MENQCFSRFSMLRKKKRYSGVYCQTVTYIFGNFSGFREWQISNYRSDKTKIFIDKVPITPHPSVGLIHKSATSKEQKKSKLMPSKQSVRVSFVTSGTEKFRKKVDDFLFLPKGVCRTARATPGLINIWTYNKFYHRNLYCKFVPNFKALGKP